MDIVRGIDENRIATPSVSTLGVFDGLHLGHQSIVKTVVERAFLTGATPTLITFDPHPRQVLKPETAPPLLQTFDQKMEGLRALGVQQVVVLKFDDKLASLSAEEFVAIYLHKALRSTEVYLGKGFAFGHNREGNIEVLRALSQKYDPASSQSWKDKPRATNVRKTLWYRRSGNDRSRRWTRVAAPYS
jgi:riboflavin kinase / FMN adenylyltransferase